MRVLPILVAAAIGTFATAAFAQTGAGSNQPPGQATTTQSSEQKTDTGDSNKMSMTKKSKKHKKAKKHDM